MYARPFPAFTLKTKLGDANTSWASSSASFFLCLSAFAF